MARKMVNVRLDDGVWHQAKVSAAKEGCTIQEWLTLAILEKSSQEEHKTGE